MVAALKPELTDEEFVELWRATYHSLRLAADDCDAIISGWYSFKPLLPWYCPHPKPEVVDGTGKGGGGRKQEGNGRKDEEFASPPEGRDGR